MRGRKTDVPEQAWLIEILKSQKKEKRKKKKEKRKEEAAKQTSQSKHG